MTPTIVCFVLVVSLGHMVNGQSTIGSMYTLPVESVYTPLMSLWNFAYLIGSTNEITLTSSVQLNTTDAFSVVTGYDLPSNTSTQFACPIISYPIAIVYNLPTLGNATLVVTESLLYRMLTQISPSMHWNDAELVSLNPLLSTLNTPIRWVLVGKPSPISAAIISYLMPNTTNNSTDDWAGNTAPARTVLTATNDYSTVVGTVNILTGSIAFLPLPMLLASGDTTLKTAGTYSTRGVHVILTSQQFSNEAM